MYSTAQSSEETKGILHTLEPIFSSLQMINTEDEAEMRLQVRLDYRQFIDDLNSNLHRRAQRCRESSVLITPRQSTTLHLTGQRCIGEKDRSGRSSIFER